MANFILNPILHHRNSNSNLGGTKQKGPIIPIVGEIWKKHPDFSNYEFSNKGRVKNITLNILMSEGLDKDGYVVIGLREGKYRTTKRIHKIIAELFVSNPNPDYYNIVNHINGIRNDNRAENLEWTDIKHNIVAANKPLSSLAKSIKYVDSNNEIKIFESIEEAACFFNITRSAIRYRLKHQNVLKERVDWLNGGTIEYYEK